MWCLVNKATFRRLRPQILTNSTPSRFHCACRNAYILRSQIDLIRVSSTLFYFIDVSPSSHFIRDLNELSDLKIRTSYTDPPVVLLARSHVGLYVTYASYQIDLRIGRLLQILKSHNKSCPLKPDGGGYCKASIQDISTA